MCCHVRSARLSARRRRQRQRPLASSPLPPLAVLDLAKPAEREVHDFLCRATSKRDRFWKLLDLRRQAATLLCVVRWVYPENASKPFSLAEVSLERTAVCWQDYATAEEAGTEMERRCVASPSEAGDASG